MTERDAAIVRLYPVVRAIAGDFSRRVPRVELDDLVGEGCLGLISAVDTYDPACRNISLERFARAHISAAMLNGIRRADCVSDHTRRVLRVAERERYALAVQRGSVPSMSEMERRHPKLRFARTAARERGHISLDERLASNALRVAGWEADPARAYAAYETRRLMREALDRLPPRHRRVVDLYYFGGFKLSAVARELSVSKQRIAQLRNDAVSIVRREVVAS